MNLKLFFSVFLIGFSLFAQTTAVSDEELDNELDTIEEPAPAKAQITKPDLSVQSYRIYQILMPEFKKHEITPQVLSSGTAATDKNNEDLNYKYGYVKSTLNYFYGFKLNQTLGVQLDYITGSNSIESGAVTTSQSRIGLGNPSLHYKGLFHFSRISLFTKLAVSFKLERETLDGSLDSGNAANGQNKLLVGFGFYHQAKEDSLVGGYLSYSRADNGERMLKNPAGSQTIKLSGGDSLSLTALTEFKNEYHPNFYLSYIKQYSTKETNDLNSISFSPSLDFLSIGGSVQIQTAPDLFFIPELSHTLALKNEFFNKYTTTQVSGSLRFLF